MNKFKHQISPAKEKITELKLSTKEINKMQHIDKESQNMKARLK